MANVRERPPTLHSRQRHPRRRGGSGPLRLCLGALAVEAVLIAAGLLAGASFDLRSAGFLTLTVLVAVTVDLVAALSWNHWPARYALAGRIGAVAAISLVGTLAAVTYINRQQGFYASFSDLFGASRQAIRAPHVEADVAHSRLDVLNHNWQAGAEVAAAAGHGTLLTVRLYGTKSQLVRHGLVYLPAAYFTDPPALHFPVLELMHGQPGGPVNYVNQLHIVSLLDAQIRARRMPALIAVMPEESTHEAYTECVDAVRGQQNDTYLSSDVVADVAGAFRTLGGRSWAIAGYSTGGFCAVNLATRHPDRYAAAASLSGYFEPAQDPGTGRLYAGSKTARRANSPIYWASHAAPVAPPLYVFASRQDRFGYAQAVRFRSVVGGKAPLLPVVFELGANGGHNWNVWRAALPSALEFVTGYLPGPLSR